MREGKFRDTVDHEVRGRDEGGGKESGRRRIGGLVSFSLGCFYGRRSTKTVCDLERSETTIHTVSIIHRTYDA